MLIISRGRFKDHITKYLRAAEKETIILTVCKQPKYVLMPIWEYEDLLKKCGKDLADAYSVPPGSCL